MLYMEIKYQDLHFTRMGKRTVWIFFIALTILQLLGCGIETYLLNDSITLVPMNSEVYKNRESFNSKILSNIDTNVIYEEYNVVDGVLSRNDTQRKPLLYAAYRFYSNGNFNLFVFDKDSVIEKNEVNPYFRGYRGVYYLKNDSIIRYDLFAPIDERRNIGKISGTFSFVGDTLYEQRDPSKGIIKINYPQEVYIKRELPPEYLNYNADW